MKKMNKDLLGLGYSGLLIGAGSMMNAKMGGYAGKAFATAGDMMPIATVAMMGSNITRMVSKTTRRKRRR